MLLTILCLCVCVSMKLYACRHIYPAVWFLYYFYMTYCDMMVILHVGDNVEPCACRRIYPANGPLLAKDPATAPDDDHKDEEEVN